ncbi:MAG: hypothetical protein A3C84_03760 [Candidatus Ryanbacteria bacterium RIFCSPHIGHO2_02_FULL_48_12]|uniref:Uncharacterized protein n=1 Tax=Candidatus Ryanbacteria bacterium RIFCSPHIGHO2_01_FULL_48_27 TaxID=1802115 RepID=A0A1G2G6J4_9BACT|nr:MAG: hypothetical protein A2756_03130 [Candidatus Ryanbacteria bacterium RIFCSPHIGHO2_01_FULL_48_27]OGZ49456.1 MAG: hypothetical protein A3C84_03760 [Candidatus Ryanbacteria bacterium RIFCSPHIGHO2_02_FULL_48_12]
MASFVLSQISIPPIQGFLYNQAGRRIGEITSNCRLHNLRASALEMSELDISFLVSSKSGLGVQENLSSLFPHTRWVVVRGRIYLIRDSDEGDDTIYVNEGNRTGYFIRACSRPRIREVLSKRGLL